MKMNITLWVVQVVLAVGFLGTGGAKALLDADSLRQIGSLPDHLPMPVIRVGGYAELLGAAALVFPGWTGVMTWLTPVAAGLLATDMAAAISYNVRWREWVQASAPVLFCALSAFVAWGRWGRWPL
jgi:uncharacterized membrane protein